VRPTAQRRIRRRYYWDRRRWRARGGRRDAGGCAR
jgi:hypothetical protein